MSKKRSRYDLPEPSAETSMGGEPPPTPPRVPWERVDAAQEARDLLAGARDQMAKLMEQSLSRVEQAMATQGDTITARLAETRAEIERIRAETKAMQDDPVNHLLRDLRQQLSSLG